jgi:hypothetical protein
VKLVVSRKQKQTSLSVIHFAVSFKLEVSKEENDLIFKYDQDRDLGDIPDVWDGRAISVLMKGDEFETDDLAKALAVEQKVQEDCQRLKEYIETASSYGGTEEFEF